ncbi:hypothetical protein D3C78_1126650 [compost metagenome]
MRQTIIERPHARLPPHWNIDHRAAVEVDDSAGHLGRLIGRDRSTELHILEVGLFQELNRGKRIVVAILLIDNVNHSLARRKALQVRNAVAFCVGAGLWAAETAQVGTPRNHPVAPGIFILIEQAHLELDVLPIACQRLRWLG